MTSESKIEQTFSLYFPDELTQWLMMEISLNRCTPLPVSQAQFWNPPGSPNIHDPRGSPTYIQDYIDCFTSESGCFVQGKTKCHAPHPNIVDALKSSVKALPSKENQAK